MGRNTLKIKGIYVKIWENRGPGKNKTILRNILIIKKLGAVPILSISNNFFCDTSLISSISNRLMSPLGKKLVKSVSIYLINELIIKTTK